MYARNGGVRLHYEVRGTAGAPPLLMIRGLARTSRHWSDELLRRLDSDFTVLVMDNRGVGKSSVPLPPYSTRQMAADAVAVLDAAGIPRCHVFGVSLGGMIAQELALRHAERVDGLALGCTRAGGRSGPGTGAWAVARILGALPMAPDDAVEHAAPLALGDAFIAARPDVIQDWRRIAREDRPRRMGIVGQIAAAVRHDTTRRLGSIRARTVVITGNADRLIHPRNSEVLAARIPGARYELLDGAAHDFATEQPEATADVLRRRLLAPA